MDSFIIKLILVIVICYFLGCFNGALVISKYILKDDVRKHGSGNAGLTNFQRSYGGGLTALVLACDVIKTVVGCLLGRFLLGDHFDVVTGGVVIGGACIILGHVFPVLYGFKGGKGILAGGTLAFMIDWRVFAIVMGAFLVLVLLTRFVSLGSVTAAILLPISTHGFIGIWWISLIIVGVGFLLVFMHRGNIVRLAKGKENKLSFRKKKPASGG